MNRRTLLMGLLGMIVGLFGSSCSKKQIRAEFVNAGDKTTIAVSDMDPGQLPDTFAIDTTLEISGKKWSVERAEPEDKTSFIKTGKVRIFLNPITMMPPGDILFSLPTIADDLGSLTGDALPSASILAIHEDDWRQIEFISEKFAAQIDAEMADISGIYKNHRAGIGFKELHVRKRIQSPLDGTELKLQDLESALSPKRRFEAVGFQRTRGTIANSFAWMIDEKLVLWGTTNAAGKVQQLCLLDSQAADMTPLVSKALAELNAEFHLILVDWCRVTKIASDREMFLKHFTTNQPRQ